MGNKAMGSDFPAYDFYQGLILHVETNQNSSCIGFQLLQKSVGFDTLTDTMTGFPFIFWLVSLTN